LIIAFLIILISWINYINLSTVRAIERAKEVGIRKAIGSSRMSLIWQFLLESVVVNLIALVLAVVVFFFLQDAYSRLVGKPIGFNVLSDPRLQLTLAGMLVMGTLCSGLYPALVLSGYQPIQVLKGKLTSTRKGFYLRNSLITFQYGASIIMTAGTLMVFKQLSFIQTQNLGIDIDQTLVLKVPSTMESDSIFANKMTTLHNEMRNYAQISETSLSTSVPGEELTWVIGGVRPVASSADMEKQYYGIGVDYHFLNAFGLKLTAGRYFREEANADFNSVVITQEAAKQLGYAKPEEAVNQMIRNWNDAQFRIVGVIGDFNQLSLKSEFKPIILFCQPGSRKYISLKLASDQVKETLPAVQAVWQKVFPGSPFNYFFLDDYFAQQYKSDLQFEKIIGLFSMLTILVTCIGIFGVSYFTTLQRVKEISIRKVMGASTRSILLLMFWKFTKLVLFSSIVALPVAGLLINKWLENYAFRTHVALWMFALPVCGILVLTFLIVSYFSHWVGQVKPIQALKND
jgi:putative ABC transport system permease protein